MLWQNLFKEWGKKLRFSLNTYYEVNLNFFKAIKIFLI